MDTLNRVDKVIVFVLGSIDDMIEDGLVEVNGKYSVSLKGEGRDMYEQLKEEGFRPTEDEIKECIAVLKAISEGSMDIGYLQ